MESPSLEQDATEKNSNKANNKAIDININVRIVDLPQNSKNYNRKKIVTSLTVSQLIYFFRILHDLKKIRSTKKSDILRFMSDTFETENASDISFKSLRAKYYHAEDKDKVILRQHLHEIIQFIDADKP
jgi:hypothetical protein